MNTDLPWIISVAELDRLQEELPELVVADVRWYLDGRSGMESYEAGHLPGAAFVDLDTVLASPPTAAEGRHPLPLPETFAAGMEVAGIGDDSVVVAYDDAFGASASRLVWLLRATGHQAAVLDGGLPAWTAAHGEDALQTGPDQVVPREDGAFAPVSYTEEFFASIDEAQLEAGQPEGAVVIDSRAPQRYRGEAEPLDARAGHIPGAVNLVHTGNIGPEGMFLPAEQIRARFTAVGVHPTRTIEPDAAGTPESVTSDPTRGRNLSALIPASEAAPIVYCGSGVTATHNLVAMAHAGIHGRLYPGSWSQYAATDRPLSTGDAS